jgi:hypothetical protein
MSLKSLGILLALGSIPSAAQVSDTPPTHNAPLKLLGQHIVGDLKVADSPNWGGYAVTGTGFTQATGSWIVPAVDCSATPTSSVSFWVGIDGWTSRTVEQTGTDSDCKNGAPRYYAWYELFPKPGITIKTIKVAAGDKMSAEINYVAPEFVVTITDTTTGASFTTQAQVPKAKRESAEWIAEMNGRVFSRFGTVSFGGDYTGAAGTNAATNATVSGPISAFGKNVWQSVLETRKGVQEAVPSALSSDGTSFTVTQPGNNPARATPTALLDGLRP